MESNKPKSLDELKQILQVLTKEEALNTKGGTSKKWVFSWISRCSGKMPL